MTGLVNLITQYSDKLNILPIVVIMNIIITILIHFLTRKKIIKYIPSLLIGFGALFLLLHAFSIFTTERGLDLSWIAVFLGTAALVGIFTCFIIDLITSIVNTNRNIEGVQQKKAQKVPIKNKKTTSTKKPVANKKRIAKKPSKAKKKVSNSKYQTQKIKAVDSNTIKATKVRDRDLKETITFEADGDEN